MIELWFSIITDFIFLCLLKDNKLIGKFFENNQNVHSDNFISKLSDFLKGNSIKLKEVDSVCFLIGPGGQTGERISFSFVTALKLVNHDLQVFYLDSLSFQAGLNKNCLSIMSIGRRAKSYYLRAYDNGNLFLNEERISVDQVNLIKERFSDFLTLFDFNEIDFFQNFVDMRNKFALFKE